jgi:hypothetical protein
MGLRVFWQRWERVAPRPSFLPLHISGARWIRFIYFFVFFFFLLFFFIYLCQEKKKGGRARGAGAGGACIAYRLPAPAACAPPPPRRLAVGQHPQPPLGAIAHDSAPNSTKAPRRLSRALSLSS